MVCLNDIHRIFAKLRRDLYCSIVIGLYPDTACIFKPYNGYFDSKQKSFLKAPSALSRSS